MTPKRSIFAARVRWVPLVFLPAVLACGASEAVGVSLVSNTGQTVTVTSGTQFTITLGTVGPGDYAVPPAVSTTSVRYLTVSVVEPFVPAGPRQRFVFEANAPGTAVIVFSHTGNNPIVADTVVVR